MAKAPIMAKIVALVLNLLALPAFGVRPAGLERISFSSGLIEVEAGTGGREIENEDECDEELQSLEKTFANTCERHGFYQRLCRNRAKETIRHSKNHHWQKHLVGKVLDGGKTPVFWAGFWPGGKKGIDTRQALADFISSVNGFQLADTEWGQAAESEGANNLENCTWDRKKNWWNVASISLAKAMALQNVPNIIIALHKTLRGKFSFYKTVLYQAELPNMGYEMWKKRTWNPEFEVRSITVKGVPDDESGCALASVVKYRLEHKAKRPVTVWCRPCTTLQACGDKQEVEKKEMEAECIEGDCQNGQGTKLWANDEEYEGQWKNGEKDGQGTYTWAYSSLWHGGNKYQGGWKNNKMEGQGTETWANGQKYQGGWKKGYEDGNGTFTWANGNKYQGGFKNGFKDGQGTFTWANGNKYQGQWKNGRKEGQGTFTYADGGKYQGQWKNGEQDGQGTLTYANGNIYRGQWKKDKKDGVGTMTLANGTKYQGEWKNGLKDGQGTYTYADGTKYEVWHKEGHLTEEVKK